MDAAPIHRLADEEPGGERRMADRRRQGIRRRVEPLDEGPLAGIDGGERRGQALDQPIEHRFVERVLRGEVIEERRFAHPDALRHVVHARAIVTALREEARRDSKISSLRALGGQRGFRADVACEFERPASWAAYQIILPVLPSSCQF